MAQGTIKRWNDEKGFGFIKSNEYKDDIFCHISAFKNLPQGLRPTVGDVVEIKVKKTAKGLQTVKAIYPHANNYTSQPSPTRRTHYQQNNSSSFFGTLTSIISFVAIIGIGYFVYQNYFNENVPAEIDSLTAPIYTEQTNQTSTTNTKSQNFTCDGRQHCSQMTSYEEAKYFIDHCPNTKMDGDGDGIPCERQFGKH